MLRVQYILSTMQNKQVELYTEAIYSLLFILYVNDEKSIP